MHIENGLVLLIIIIQEFSNFTYASLDPEEARAPEGINVRTIQKISKPSSLFSEPMKQTIKKKKPTNRYKMAALGSTAILLCSTAAYYGPFFGAKDEVLESTVATADPEKISQIAQMTYAKDEELTEGTFAENAIANITLLLETSLMELFRPRNPPFTIMDIIRCDYNAMGAHLGEQLYVSTERHLELFIQWIASAKRQVGMAHMAFDKDSTIGSIVETIIKSSDGRLLFTIIKILARRYAYPFVMAQLVRWCVEEGATTFAMQLMDIFGDSFTHLMHYEKVQLAVALVTPQTSLNLLRRLFENLKISFPRDVAVDMLVKMGEIGTHDYTKFLGFYELFLRELYPPIKDYVRMQMVGDVFELVPRMRRLWDLRNLYAVLRTEGESFNPKIRLKEFTTIVSKELVQQDEWLETLDWYISKSEILEKALIARDEDCKLLLDLICEYLNLAGRISALVDYNATTLLWLVFDDEDPLDSSDIDYIAYRGDAASLSAAFALNRFDIHNLKLGGIISKGFRPPWLTPEKTIALKKSIMQLSEIAHKIFEQIYKSGDDVCGSYGSASQDIIVDLLWLDELHSTREEFIELAMAFIEMAFQLPRCLMPALDELTWVPTMATWINGSLHYYCSGRQLKPTVCIVQRERLPAPNWLRRMRQGI